jgi:hypothetical protein
VNYVTPADNQFDWIAAEHPGIGTVQVDTADHQDPHGK